jgi:hypothetical protein
MKNHQESIQAMFGDLAEGLREIVWVHDLEHEVVEDIAGLVEDLFDKHVWRRCLCRSDQHSMHAMSRDLAMGMCEIIDAHDLGDEVAWHLAEVLEGLLKTNQTRSRTRQASVQELIDDLFAIYRGDRDEEPPTPRELLDELLAMHFERRRNKRKPRRRAPHPVMAELLARLDRYGADHEKSPSEAAPAAN